MALDISVQQQLISAIADAPNCSLARTFGPMGTPLTDNLLYLQDAGVVGVTMGAEEEDGGRFVSASFTTQGQAFVEDPFGQEAIVRSRIREKLTKLEGLTEGQLQEMRRALDMLPGDATQLDALRLIDVGLSGGPKAVWAVREFLKRQQLSQS